MRSRFYAAVKSTKIVMLSIRFYAGLQSGVYDFVPFGNVLFVKDAVTSAARFWSELRR